MTGWLGVEPRHLAALVAVHEERSFRGAAARLGLVQSAVSQRIAQLEQFVGMTLVERARGQANVSLTHAGMTLVDHAGEILAEFDAVLADLRAVPGDTPAPLRVGTYESVAGLLVAPALAQLKQTAPQLRFSLHEDADWQRFFPLVSSGVLDAAFADLPLERGPFTFRELTRDPCVLVVRADSPLARRREPPTLAEIGALPLIAPSWPMLRLISDNLRAAGIEPSFVFRSEANSGVQALVAHGVGAALMPRLAVNANDPRIALVPLEDELPARRIAIYWHRDRREATAIMRLVEALEAICRVPDDVGEPPEPKRLERAA